MVSVTLRYTGSLADQHMLDMYDASRALAGFQRSLALTTHLVLHGEIITQAPSLRDASIIVSTPEEGSWKVVAAIFGAIFTVGSVGKDSPVGQIVTSVYDYVLSETMGFHVDYDKTLQQQYHDHFKERKITREKLDSLMEKTESSVSDMHRPIVASKSATGANLYEGDSRTPKRLGPNLSHLTYEYIAHTVKSDDEYYIDGVVSSYNINTFKGRIFSPAEQRPIPFELEGSARNSNSIGLITESLRLNAIKRDDPRALLRIKAFRFESSTGRLKALRVTEVTKPDSFV